MRRLTTYGFTFVLLFTSLACASAPKVNPALPPPPQQFVRHNLDASKVKTLADVREVFEALQLYFAYRVEDADSSKRYEKVKRLCK